MTDRFFPSCRLIASLRSPQYITTTWIIPSIAYWNKKIWYSNLQVCKKSLLAIVSGSIHPQYLAIQSFTPILSQDLDSSDWIRLSTLRSLSQVRVTKEYANWRNSATWIECCFGVIIDRLLHFCLCHELEPAELLKFHVTVNRFLV